MFMRVLIGFNALGAINPVSTLIITFSIGMLPNDGNFWILSTAGMFFSKILVAHIASLHLSWLLYPHFAQIKVYIIT